VISFERGYDWPILGTSKNKSDQKWHYQTHEASSQLLLQESAVVRESGFIPEISGATWFSSRRPRTLCLPQRRPRIDRSASARASRDLTKI